MIDICCGVIFAMIVVWIIFGIKKKPPRRPTPSPLPRPKKEDLWDGCWGSGGQAYKRRLEHWNKPVGFAPGHRRMF